MTLHAQPFRTRRPLALSIVGVLAIALAGHAPDATARADESASSPAGPVRDANTELELLAEHQAIQPGQPIHLGLRMEMDEHWHSYWLNPGDSGMATTFAWDLPEGFEAGTIRWPHPDRFELGGLISYGYEGQILLPVRIDVPERIDAERVTLTVDVNWLACKEICIPGDATLSVTLPVTGNEPHVNPAAAELFEASRQRQPRALDADAGERAGVHREGESLVLRTEGLIAVDAEIIDAYFYASEGRKLAYGAGQPMRREAGDELALVLTVSPLRTSGDGPVEHLEGVLVIEMTDDTRAFAIDATVTDGPEEAIDNTP